MIQDRRDNRRPLTFHIEYDPPTIIKGGRTYRVFVARVATEEHPDYGRPYMIQVHPSARFGEPGEVANIRRVAVLHLDIPQEPHIARNEIRVSLWCQAIEEDDATLLASDIVHLLTSE